MSKQNIYDNNHFFEEYKALRDKKNNANVLIEKPAFLSLLPNLKDKTILDLGCGFGEACVEYINLGAKNVIGIDISKRMLEVANLFNKDDKIEYINMPIEDINKLDLKFDIICSSLVLHYISDYKGLVNKIYNTLNKDGYFIFSIEHPLGSTYQDGRGPRWEKDENGNKVCSRLFDYCIEGKRLSKWFDIAVEKYHRTFQTILNSLIEVGFSIDKILEPILSEEEMKKYPEFMDNYHRPDFLLIKAYKN